MPNFHIYVVGLNFDLKIPAQLNDIHFVKQLQDE